MKPRILLVDDDCAIQFGFTKYLSRLGHEISAASGLNEAKELVQAQRYDAILLDLNLPDGNGLDWITDLKENQPDMSIIVITGIGDIPTAVEAMRRGADNFLTKPVNMAELDIFIKKGLEVGLLRRNNIVRERLFKHDRPFFGTSPGMSEAVKFASFVSSNDSIVMLQGETGTGKGVLARFIHEHSARRSAPYVEINCSGLRGEMLASELFGHAKGAFTTAIKDRQGLIEIADNGTLFLDEIGDMDLHVQAQFLKVIEEKQFRRLGEVKVRSSDFRLICATNKNIKKEVEEGNFRKDLFFRILVFPIALQPLRMILEDLPGLVRHLLGALGASDAGVTPEATGLLISYPWPGNIRELRNVLERALLLSQGGKLGVEHFPGLEDHITEYSRKDKGPSPSSELTRIEETIRSFDGDITKAAKALSISRATLYRRLKGGKT